MHDISITEMLTRVGLVVVAHHSDDSFTIARPSSVRGTVFRDFTEPTMIGIGSVSLLTNAPFATITRKRRPIRWVAEISIPAAPGPGPVYYRETFDKLTDSASAIIDCFFGTRIDFDNESLKTWGMDGDQTLKRG